MTIKQPIRIGRINFANAWPIFYNFPHDQFKDEVEFISQVPTSLNQALARNEIDMAAVSSFAYGQDFSQYVLLPDLSVSAFGEVQSLLLFHQKPIAELGQGTIALPTTSATSVNLLKILLTKFNGIRPQYQYAAPSLNDMMKQADAALLIGDDAIKAKWTNSDYKVMDLGEMWRRATGKWMSFAVWAVRKQVVEEQPELVARIYKAFLYSKQMSLLNLKPLIAEAQQTIGGNEAYWQRYFTQLKYDFGPEQWEGLQLYYDYAYDLGLLPHKVPIQIWQDTKLNRVKE
ncbi:ABC transporter substrate-binding protein [Paenibacillus psychroresistens]|uniref:Chorismate dehydratase n=1 Tax=Paenibacillus psychroresistens TaxID=1778678 RepID=A0A6B8RMG4_9BACL|nr:menaquinone biosynthesis protein [Paenibacillus psychroresistens]QGQ96872.1 ABC transporter substrate-binding protein [Paenibacillus psychroresistens]